MSVRTESPRLGRASPRDSRPACRASIAKDVSCRASEEASSSGCSGSSAHGRSPFGYHARETAIDRSHPYLRFDPTRCITCRLCLHACAEIQGQFVYAIAGRGGEAHLVFGPGERFAESDCTACGACVDHCPTGAILDRDREEVARPAAATHRLRRSRSPSPSVATAASAAACEIETGHAQGLRIRGVPEAAVNRGHLCAKGRYAHALAEPPRTPDDSAAARRRERSARSAGSQAVAWLARRLREIRDAHGPNALGVMTSSRSTNEAAYLLQKLFRTAIGTNNVDCCARVCHSSTAAGPAARDRHRRRHGFLRRHRTRAA